jgi:hypothetical protein
MECVTYMLEVEDTLHVERTVTTWGNPEKLIVNSKSSSKNHEDFFKLQGDSSSKYRHVVLVQQDCITSMNWHQGVLSSSDQVIEIVLRDHGIALKKYLRANEYEFISLSKNLNFNMDITSPPYHFTIEIHHSEPIEFKGKGSLDFLVINTD